MPRIIGRPESGGRVEEKRYFMPTHPHLNADVAHANEDQDITGGLPRVVELFKGLNITKRYVHPQEQTIRAAMDRAQEAKSGHTSGVP
jgi:hypothetical protein